MIPTTPCLPLTQSVIESDSEDDGDSFVRKSMHPPCPAESTVYKKRRRYITWNSKPAIMASDLQKCKAVAAKSREEFSSLERDEERWAECFEMARHRLNASLASCQEKNNRLRLEAKHLYELVVLECGPGLSSRKRRASQMRDILEELHDRQTQLQGNIDEYREVVGGCEDVAKVDNASNGSCAVRCVPVINMTIDELDYPEDAMIWKGPATNAFDAKKKVAPTENSIVPVPKVSGMQSRRDLGAKNIPRSRAAAIEGEEDRNGDMDQDDGDDSDGVGGGAGMVAEFCAMFAAVDGCVRLGEASLADLDPFFSDDEAEDGVLVATKGGVKGSGLAKASSASAKATAVQRAATLKAASTWDSYAEYQKECKLAEPFAVPRDKKQGGWEMHWAQCVADASQCPDLLKSGSAVGQVAVPRTRLARGIGSGAVTLSAFAISRTPRGVPLIISPLSQFEDRYLGAVCGSLTGTGVGVGAAFTVSPTATAVVSAAVPAVSQTAASEAVANSGVGSTTPAAVPSPVAGSKVSSDKKAVNTFSAASTCKEEAARCERQDAVAVHVDVMLPASLIAAEDAALERCRLQSLAAAAENKIKRLRASNIEWCRQASETSQSLQRSKALFSQAHREDLMESKMIRRELIARGIITAKDTDPPLSPVGEYLPAVPLHAVGKGKGGGGPVNRKGVRSIRGLNFAVANAAMQSSSPTPPPFISQFSGSAKPLVTVLTAEVMARLLEGVADDEGGSLVDDVSVVDQEDMEGEGEGDANGLTSSQDPSHAKGKEKAKTRAVKSKTVVKGKEEEVEVQLDSPANEEEEASAIDSQSNLGDSPMNNGSKKRGKTVPVGGAVLEGTTAITTAAAAKRRGNAAANSAARRR